MAVVLWGYLEELILYHLGAYACFDLKTRMPWLQMVGAGVCVLLACVEEAVLACRRSVCSDQWNGRNCGTAGNDISVQNKLPCMFQIQNLLYISCSHTGNFAVFYDFFCLWERCSNTL